MLTRFSKMVLVMLFMVLSDNPFTRYSTRRTVNYLSESEVINGTFLMSLPFSFSIIDECLAATT